MDEREQVSMEDTPRPVHATTSALAGLSGLEILRGFLGGSLTPPNFVATTAISLVEVSFGHAVFKGTPSELFLNGLGSIHGGWVATILDSAMAAAVHSRLAAGQSYATLEMKVNLLKQVKPTSASLMCSGKVVHFGARIAVAEARLTADSGDLIAIGNETCLIIDGRRRSKDTDAMSERT